MNELTKYIARYIELCDTCLQVTINERMHLPIRLKAEQLKKQLAPEQPKQEVKVEHVKEGKKKEEDAPRLKKEDEKRKQEEQEKELQTQMDKEVRGHYQGARQSLIT